jgi:integrase
MPEKEIIVWVQHRGDRPYLTLDWHDPVTGQRKSRSAKTCNPVEAEKLRKDLEYELNHNIYQEPSRTTWSAFRELFKEQHLAGSRVNTQRNYQATLDLFERLCHPKALRDVDEGAIWKFYAAMRKEPGRRKEEMMASTIQVRLQHLHTALNWAVKRKLIPACPAFPKVKVPKKRPQATPEETIERLLAKAPDENMRTFLLTGWLAGLRLSEAFSLEWEPSEESPWLDLDRNRIVLPARFVKGVEDQWLPLDPRLREALLGLPRTGKRVFRFMTAVHPRPISLSGVGHRVIALARRAGVKLTMKSLRKGFGCRYAGKVPAQVLQKLMRHSNNKITMDYYANVDAAVEEAVLGRKDSFPEKKPENNSGPQTEPRSTSRSTNGIICTDAASGSDGSISRIDGCS